MFGLGPVLLPKIFLAPLFISAFSAPPLIVRFGVNERLFGVLLIELGTEGGNMIASAGNGFWSSSPSRNLFSDPGVEKIWAAGSRLSTERNGARCCINGVVEAGGAICDKTGLVIGVGSGMAITLFRLVFISNSLSPNCRVSLATFLSTLAFALNASRVRSSASSTSCVLIIKEASSSGIVSTISVKRDGN